MKYLLPLLTIVLLLLTGVRAQAATVIYNETFPADAGGTGNAALEGWTGLQGGGTLNQLEITGSGGSQLDAINSNPQNTFDGAAAWNQGGSDISIFTDEYTFSAHKLTGINLQTLNDSSKDRMHLILKIDGSWLVSTDSFKHKGSKKKWVDQAFDVQGMTWTESYKDPADPAGSGIRWNPGGIELTLPTLGTVEAFGVYVENATGTVRIDNVTVSAIPEPETILLMGIGVLLFGGYIYRQRSASASA